jgi:TonB dependent receptor/TonB-dependent Receptor Plug Domain
MPSWATLVATMVVAASPAPSPCPSAAGVSAPPAPAPCASPASRELTEIGRVNAPGRGTILLGKTVSASQGTISQAQLETRPVARPGEVLEAIPGVIVTQHSGEGKANQYYLRGFQLDHGTDLAATISGQPVNLPTHAHGQGYSDVNWLLPELVSFVEFKKGPYFADEGDFSTAGAYDLYYRNTIPDTVQLSAGSSGFGRILLAGSPKLGAGNLLYALEAYHDDGTFERPDNYRRLNGVLRYSRSHDADDLNVTLMGYDGRWSSSDQIPQRRVGAGGIGRFGLIDPSDGGTTYRYALSAQFERRAGNATTKLSAYAVRYSLDLFSNFTYSLDDATDYYNVTANPVTCSTAYSTCAPAPNHVGSYTAFCPANAAPPGPGGAPRPFAFACGDQREQQDSRFVTGLRASRSWQMPRATNTVGFGLRNDNIATVGLFLDTARVRDPTGTLTDDHVVERAVNAYAQTEQRLGPKLRAVAGVRADLYRFDVHAADPRNSGTRTAGLVSPKLSLAFRLSPAQELYASAGESFHSNDGRGTTIAIDPQTHAAVDPSGAPVQRVSPLVRANGEEIGYRYATAKRTTTVSLWRLGVASELVFSGDAGTTAAGRPTVRKGIEIANFWTPTRRLTFDADFATSTARFTTDPDRIGTGVPESLASVAALGVTVDEPAYSASLRLRYFGPRNLIEDGSASSRPATLLNGRFTAKLARGNRLSLDVFNILNASADDTTYFYSSWTRADAANPALASDRAVNPALGGSGVADYHFHPAPKRTFRLALTTRL